MEFSLSEEQEAIFDVAYSFGQENIAPFAIQWEKKEQYLKNYGAKSLNLALEAFMFLKNMEDQA